LRDWEFEELSGRESKRSASSEVRRLEKLKVRKIGRLESLGAWELETMESLRSKRIQLSK